MPGVSRIARRERVRRLGRHVTCHQQPRRHSDSSRPPSVSPTRREPYPQVQQDVVEALAEIDTDLVDPFLPKFIEQQPDAAQVAWQCATIDAMAESLGL